ncbi:MAG: type IV secretion system DNA-binding domain-containing protein [Blastomonas sp.]|uniref:type IV secretory system conjugative DNA transfer family protein n=1 Tax=Blastomonas sp. TaxID=1909299 RepID=UPI00258CF7A0|nr:TraM recognition domain-containing protein [Blastomonas sp.]MCO5792821.1 type IV secretion system DNA-binding domain-containing protein [Blastomonas sp.]
MLSDITPLGSAYHRHGDRPFGIRQADRLHHIYAIGQTGTGKSTFLLNLALHDALAGRGFCLIDPHGDLALALHQHLETPHHYFDIADPACRLGYNPLTRVPRSFRPLLASGLIETLKKQWADSWGARMEHLLRYAILALLDQPQADIRDIVRLYVDKDFRKAVVARIEDEQARAFWTVEFPNMNYMNAIDGVAPIANKLGAFLANPVVRRAVCAPEDPIRFRRIMDERQILIVNLAKGRLGTDMANVMGGLVVSTVMLAAFSRHGSEEKARQPFALHIDEFPSFTTEAFANLLPEARKYGLSLTLAHQHISQVERPVFDAVLGNAGTIVVFRLGAQDAPEFSRQLGEVPASDLIRIPNRQAYVQLMVDGQKTKPFSMRTWPPPDAQRAYSAS